jgi:ParD-like antitoxin of type II bacterial toxin-antitoxin system
MIKISSLKMIWRKLPLSAKLHDSIAQEFAMPTASTAFNSVKLPSALVIEARQTAIAMRRSTAGQIEYWAMLGKAVEDGGLTAREAAQALGRKSDASPTNTAALLDDIEARFAQAESSGSLALRMREVVMNNRQQAASQGSYRLAA